MLSPFFLKATYWMPAERHRLRRVTWHRILLYEDLLWFQNLSRCGHPELRRYYSRAPKRAVPRACPLDTNRLDPRRGAWPCWRPDEFTRIEFLAMHIGHLSLTSGGQPNSQLSDQDSDNWKYGSELGGRAFFPLAVGPEDGPSCILRRRAREAKNGLCRRHNKVD